MSSLTGVYLFTFTRLRFLPEETSIASATVTAAVPATPRCSRDAAN